MSKTLSNIEVWKSRLLDTSKRNRAINFKETKLGSIRVIEPSLPTLLGWFEEKKIEFADLFKGFQYTDAEDSDLDLVKIESSLTEDTISDELQTNDESLVNILVQGVNIKKKEKYQPYELEPVIQRFLGNLSSRDKVHHLFSDRFGTNQQNALKNIYKKGRSYQEEYAIDITYFALGMVTYFENINSNNKWRAPLMFASVALHQTQFDAPYQIDLSQAELTLNEAFIKMLEVEYNIKHNFVIDNTKENKQIYLEYQQYLRTLFVDSRWTIDDEVHLSLFTFAKINMVKDLEQNQTIIANHPLIQAISGDDHEIITKGKIYAESDLDKLLEPLKTYQVVEADSSQSLAIQSAISGKSFVLQGPPGTGKSQTITNIIAELIGRGKKVLFVAEKKAALAVVKNNLAKVGLDEYAIALHNHDLNRQDFVKDLEYCLYNRQQTKNLSDQEINTLVHNYDSSLFNLKTYAEEILLPRHPLNISLFQLIGDYFKLENIPSLVFTIPNFDELTQTDLNNYQQLITQFQAAYAVIKYDEFSHPWYGLTLTQANLGIKETLAQIIDDCITSANNIMQYLDKIKHFKLPTNIDYSWLEGLLNIILHIQSDVELNQATEKLFNQDYFEQANIDLGVLNEQLKVLQHNLELKQQLNQHYTQNILDIDAKALLKVMNEHDSFFKRLFSKTYKTSTAQIKNHAVTPKLSHQTIKADLVKIIKVQDNQANSQKLQDQLHYKEVFTHDLVELQANIQSIKWYYDLFNQLSEKSIDLQVDVNTLQKTVKENDVIFVRQMMETHVANISKLQEYFEVNALNFSTINISSQNAVAKKLKNSFNVIDDFMRYNFNKNRLFTYGLNTFFNQINVNKVTDDYYPIFQKRLYLLLIDDILTNDPFLQHFNSHKQQQFKKLFNYADRKLQKVAKILIDNKIIKDTPIIGSATGLNYEVSVLRREATKVRKVMPIRQLFEVIPNIILTLKPVIMMSPLAVSTYLKSSSYQFDTVIFDEASQVRPESAALSIFRGKQVIIVGDSEQLPPTSFFDSMSDDDTETDGDTAAFDSILEMADAALNKISLKWHYRSKYEELIQTSNQEIYHQLVTFPYSRQTVLREGLEFVKVNGYFVDRQNLAEAKEVVRLVQEHFDTFKGERSLGIVAFSATQQRAIENELDQLRRAKPEYEEYFHYDEHEPLFVKNIETVQGDERDTIIMSVGYAKKDERSPLSMNFGPLNNQNGYRRLNVAITRAKLNLIVVSSITDADIDLTRTEAKGAIMLKAFLNNAQHGFKTDAQNTIKAVPPTKLEDDIYQELVKLGYHVDRQVGKSGYKIDLAIRHPNKKTHYIMGVECDGSVYQNSQSTRDRDRLRQAILESRGWRVYRIYSVDWFKNKQAEIKKLDELIDLIIANENTLILKAMAAAEAEKEIEVTETPREQEKITFLEYPSFDEIYRKYPGKIYETDLGEILLLLTPIHLDDVKKLLPPFFGKQKYSPIVEEQFAYRFSRIQRSHNLLRKGDYIVSSNQPAQFRMTTLKSYQRHVLNIHLDELVDGALKIINSAKKLEKESLYRYFMTYLRISQLTKPIRDRFDEALHILKENNQIRVKNDIIELA